MTDLPAATRTRLDDLVNGQAPYTLGDYRLDLRALLAAYDHAVANLVEVHDRWANVEVERDALRAAQAQLVPCYEDARSTAARLLIEQEQYAQTVRNLTERAEFARARATAAEAAQAEAAPVLEAAEAYADLCLYSDRNVGSELIDAVAAWRATRAESDNQAPPGTPPVVAQAATGVSSTRTCDHCATPLTRETAIYQGDVRLCATCDAAWRAVREG